MNNDSGLKPKLILVTGSGRSGTTLLGKIIASHNNTEYFYEPITFINLIKSELSGDETVRDYILYDLLHNSLAGRSINMNTNDDSCIFNYKSKKNVDNRISKSLVVDQFNEIYLNYSSVIKMPSYTSLLGNFSSPFFDITKILLIRHPAPVIRSILIKQWFSDEKLSKRELWGVRYKDLFIPNYIPESQRVLFYSASEIDRCHIYYISCYHDQIVSKFDHVIDYDDVLLHGHTIINDLSEKLKLKPGELTEKVLSSVQTKSVDKQEVTSVLYDKALMMYNNIRLKNNS